MGEVTSAEGNNMAATHTEALRLAAITNATKWSRLADEVVLATIQWERDGDLDSASQTAVRECAEWLADLESLLADPLDLPATSQRLGSLTVPSPFATFGTEAAPTNVDPGRDRADGESADWANADIAERDTIGRLAEMRQRLMLLLDGEVDRAQVTAIRRGFEGVASAMLQSTGEMLAQGGNDVWLTVSNSSLS